MSIFRIKNTIGGVYLIHRLNAKLLVMILLCLTETILKIS